MHAMLLPPGLKPGLVGIKVLSAVSEVDHTCRIRSHRSAMPPNNLARARVVLNQARGDPDNPVRDESGRKLRAFLLGRFKRGAGM